MPVTRPDGSVLYSYPDALASVTFNGAALAISDLIEVLVEPDGWGRVLLKKALVNGDDGRSVAGAGKTLVDGQTRNFVYWGWVVVTLP